MTYARFATIWYNTRQMAPNKRIFLNIVATYGRSLYALIIGLFCGRWTLMALGEVDYGLVGVVGGLTAFIAFLNGVMACGVGRFYALSVGAEQRNPVAGLESCREWFTTAVVVHTVMPLVLTVAGYPLGEWAVRHFLTIPADRIDACVWVWKFTCLSCFVGMASTPYHAMYGAKQEIAELTIYSFVTTTLNAIFMCYVIHHPGDWLTKYAAWGCALSIVPSLLITGRSIFKYKECRIRLKSVCCFKRIKEMLSYSSWLIIGNLAALLRGQGVVVLINKLFGPTVNAAAAIGNSLSGHCESLSGSLINAFSPAIMNAYGAGDIERVKDYSLKVCKYSTMLIMFFGLPMMVEVDDLLFLWLKNPPTYTSMFCVLAIVMAIVDKMTWGYLISVHAQGEIAIYQCVVGGVLLLALPFALVLYWLGAGVYCASIASIVMFIFASMGRLFFAKKLLSISIREWMQKCLVPLCCVAVCGIFEGAFVHRCLVAYAPLLRFLMVSISIVAFTTPMYWFFLLSANDREYVATFVKRRLCKR